MNVMFSSMGHSSGMGDMPDMFDCPNRMNSSLPSNGVPDVPASATTAAPPVVGAGVPPEAAGSAPPGAPPVPPAPPDAEPAALDVFVAEAVVTGTSTADGIASLDSLAVGEPLVAELGVTIAASVAIAGDNAVELAVEPGEPVPAVSSEPTSSLAPFAAPLLQAKAPRASPRITPNEFPHSLESSHSAGIIGS
jgi:hypothetical protein